MDLSIRLQMNADLVPEESRVADIGCDHGYVSIYLAEKKKCPKIIAMDVNKGPLSIAERNIRQAGLDRTIECRLSNGMERLFPGEIDTVLIAGMGGMLVCQILQGNPDVLAQIQTLVLQAQSDIRQVRKLLPALGFFIEEEAVCQDAGKYYLAIRAVRGTDTIPYTEAEYTYGRLLPQRRDGTYRSYLLAKKAKLEQLKDQLKKKNTPNTEARIHELSHTLMETTQTLAKYIGGEI